MKKEYKIIGKTGTRMPDLIISDQSEEFIIDPFVSCVIGTSRFRNNLDKINLYIDSLIGKNVMVDLDNCGFVCNSFIPYMRKDFKIVK